MIDNTRRRELNIHLDAAVSQRHNLWEMITNSDLRLYQPVGHNHQCTTTMIMRYVTNENNPLFHSAGKRMTTQFAIQKSSKFKAKFVQNCRPIRMQNNALKIQNLKLRKRRYSDSLHLCGTPKLLHSPRVTPGPPPSVPAPQLSVAASPILLPSLLEGPDLIFAGLTHFSSYE